MKLTTLAAAAAVFLSSLGVSAAADAQPMRERTVVRTNGDRTVVRTRTVVRGESWRGDNGRHLGWRNNRTRRVCSTVWRHHHRERICRVVRWHR
jgi:hypothetical protein